MLDLLYLSYCLLQKISFRTFLFFSFCDIELTFGTGYMNLSWYNTDQVWLLSWLPYFYMNYCPLLKFHFPHFFLSSLKILTWNFIYMNLSWCNTGQVQLLSRLTYFYLSYCPLQKFIFPNFLSCLLRYWLEIWFMNLSWHIQIKFDFCFAWPTFTWIFAFC